MDLKDGKITVGELMDHPAAGAVLRRRFPMVMKHPPEGAARSVTLEQILDFAQSVVSRKKVEETLAELERA